MRPAHASERSLPEHPCPKCRTMMEPIGGEAYACKKCGYSSVGAAHASEPWTPKFAGGDAWRIEGSPCSYGYSKQQAEEICNAHNEPAHASEQEKWTHDDKIIYCGRDVIGRAGTAFQAKYICAAHNATLSQRPTPATEKR